MQPISPEQQSCLPEAMLHLQLYPHDTNFVFAPTPNTGYGCATLPLPLTPFRTGAFSPY